MAGPSSACIDRLREIEKELDNLTSMVANARARSSPPTQLRNVFFSALDGAYEALDEDCIEILRGLEPLIGAIGHVASRGTNMRLAERQIASAKALIRAARGL